MFCHNCGDKLCENAAYCSKCGTAIGGVAPVSAPPTPVVRVFFCKKCEGQLPNGKSYCANCDLVDEEAWRYYDPPKPGTDSTVPRLLRALGAISILLGPVIAAIMAYNVYVEARHWGDPFFGVHYFAEAAVRERMPVFITIALVGIFVGIALLVAGRASRDR